MPELTRVVALLAIIGSLFLAACGGSGGGFRDPGPCPTPTPVADEQSGPAAYVDHILDELAVLDRRARQYHQSWPRRQLSESESFRNAYAAYAHAAACQVNALREVDPSGPFGEFHEQLMAALDAYARVMDQGLNAVRTRNVSEFERWDRNEARAVADLRDLADELRETFPGSD